MSSNFQDYCYIIKIGIIGARTSLNGLQRVKIPNIILGVAMDARQHIKQLIALPPVPKIATALLKVLNDDTTDIDQIADLINQEPGITAKIIGMANSVFYHGRVTICKTEKAIVKIGMSRIKNIVLGILLVKHFNPKQCPSFQLERYWYNAMVVAYCASQLVSYVDEDSTADCAHLCGLIHNIGLLVLAHIQPNEMNKILLKKNSYPDRRLADLEQEILGINHYQAGAILCEQWGMPIQFVLTVRYYGDSNYNEEYSELARLIRFCCAWKAMHFQEIPSAENFSIVDLASTDDLDEVAVLVRNESEQIASLAKQMV